MSAIKRAMDDHEDHACDPAACLVCQKERDSEPVDHYNESLSCQDEDSRFAPLIRPADLQAELQAKLDALQAPSPAELNAFQDEVARNNAAWELCKDGALMKYACENPKGYETLMAVIQRHLTEALNEESSDAD